MSIRSDPSAFPSENGKKDSLFSTRAAFDCLFCFFATVFIFVYLGASTIAIAIIILGQGGVRFIFAVVPILFTSIIVIIFCKLPRRFEVYHDFLRVKGILGYNTDYYYDDDLEEAIELNFDSTDIFFCLKITTAYISGDSMVLKRASGFNICYTPKDRTSLIHAINQATRSHTRTGVKTPLLSPSSV
eukprot:TRINITY_DN3297_c1_g1_i2.p1 TRINITY_DN3297_c1_g1~~TRINITY_DN3297_c1_g1_i2.p1  ORF type:complete len:187 (-),score=30.74 TRINITY_DN3297_c1_g1_i2:231-791(-)